MVLVDAHVKEGEQARALQHAVTQHMPNVHIHVTEPISNRLGGLVVMWDTQQWTYTHKRVVVKGRVTHGTLHKAGEETEGERWEIYNAYMPVRVAGNESKSKDETVWDSLHTAVSSNTSPNVVVVGDLNAEPMSWVSEGKGVKHWANDKLHELCLTGWVPTIQEEATYAAGTLIDNILVPKSWEGRIRSAYTMRGPT